MDFFPNIQFIVTTHSPFVISSVENAVVCDLEHREIVNDLSAYSYSILAETWFDVDKYSEPLKSKVARIQALLSKQRTPGENSELKVLVDYLAALPQGAIDDELALQLQTFKLEHRDIFKAVKV
jgi:predicted ATP-binding protein involved in virulence